MTITATQVKEIGMELAKLKAAKVTLDGNRGITMKEGVFAPNIRTSSDEEKNREKTQPAPVEARPDVDRGRAR